MADAARPDITIDGREKSGHVAAFEKATSGSDENKENLFAGSVDEQTLSNLFLVCVGLVSLLVSLAVH